MHVLYDTAEDPIKTPFCIVFPCFERTLKKKRDFHLSTEEVLVRIRCQTQT